MLRTFAAAAALAALSLLATPATARAQVEAVPPPPPPPPPPIEPPPPPPVDPPGTSPPPSLSATPAALPARMPHLRLYAGGAAANQAARGSGNAVLLGFQTYTDFLPILQSYWGTELLGVQVGSIVLPILAGDLGVRVTPFPDWLLRPYARANVGLTMVVFLPVPSAGVAVGLMLPIFNTIFFDITLGVRRAFNFFDLQQSVDLAVLELSVGI